MHSYYEALRRVSYIYTVYYTRIVRTYVHLCKHVFTLNTFAQCFPAEGGWAALRRHPADPSGAGYSGQEGWLARLPFTVGIAVVVISSLP
jgi:hypothetical protein